MPLPMVHLLLAEKIGERTGHEPDAYFLLGSLAPDSIHTRLGTNRKDKHKTHFFRGKKWDDAEVCYHWELVLDKLEKYAEKEEYLRSFATGYCIHTLLDMTWIEQVFNVLARTLHAGGIGFEDVRTKYYAETNVLDAFLYKNSAWAEKYRRLIETVIPIGFEDLLTAKEIGLWKNIILSKMDCYASAKIVETYYIHNDNVQKFIDDLADKILLAFAERGYNWL